VNADCHGRGRKDSNPDAALPKHIVAFSPVCVSYRFAAFALASIVTVPASVSAVSPTVASAVFGTPSRRLLFLQAARSQHHAVVTRHKDVIAPRASCPKAQTRELRPALVRGRTPACKVEFADEGLAVEHQAISARRFKIPLQADSIFRRGVQVLGRKLPCGRCYFGAILVPLCT
jgi:hypothetical protein